jgi:hypothetical protein
MTEAEWLVCDDPAPMLQFLLRGRLPRLAHMRRAAATAMRRRYGWDRKFRLYACACLNDSRLIIRDERLREAIVIFEGYADKLTTDEAFRTAKRQVRAIFDQALAFEGPDGLGQHVASVVSDVMGLRFLPGWTPVWAREIGIRLPEFERHTQEVNAKYCRLLFDVFGPLPFRRMITASHWLTPTVMALAGGIYADRAFDLLPILADALEDAGCDNADILAHCRDPGPHVRGCWVLDLILGKE